MRFDVNMFLCVRQYARELFCRCVVDNIIIIKKVRRRRRRGEGGKFTFAAQSEGNLYNIETIISGLKALKYFQIFRRLHIDRADEGL